MTHWRPDALIARFTLIGVVVGIIVASGLAWFIEARLTTLMLDQVVARAIDQRGAMLNELNEADFSSPHTPARLADLAARLDPLLSRLRDEGSGILRLHLFAADGTVLYSDLALKRGQRESPSESPLLATSLLGSSGSRVSTLSSPENGDLKARYDSALEVYVPLLLDGQVVGAFEIYQDLSPVRPVRPLVWSTVAGGFAVLFLSLLLVVRGAARHIRRQQQERERLVRQAADAARAEAETLRRVDRLKDDLISVVSHELRTPLASIVGFVELLMAEHYSEAERREFLKTLHAEGLRLTTLLNDFLDLRRMESGSQQTRPSPTSVSELLREAATAAGQDPARPILVHIPDTLPLVLADTQRLRQVLANLLSNARKFSPRGGQVDLSARRVGGYVEVAVADHGLGLPAQAVPQLFQRFYRVENPAHRDITGTGLGLMICRKIVEAHHGRIWAESPGLGHGSRFCFILPLASAARPDTDEPLAA